MTLLEGKPVADAIRSGVTNVVSALRAAGKRAPGLATILVGNNPASESYVASKDKACHQSGFFSEMFRLPAETTESALLELIAAKNLDDRIDGILVQLPLPKHIAEQKIIEAISPDKDVDGFHPVNVGRLLSGLPAFRPCTPAGIIELLKFYNIQTRGKHVVIVGRSNIVGKPAASMLMQKKDFADAVVTVCHSAAPDITVYTQTADILIAAIGRPDYITAEMLRPNTVVIDVGINRVADDSTTKGYRVTGDVDFQSVSKICSHITPVPGGVGVLTIAMLLKNTLESYKRREGNV